MGIWLLWIRKKLNFIIFITYKQKRYCITILRVSDCQIISNTTNDHNHKVNWCSGKLFLIIITIIKWWEDSGTTVLEHIIDFKVYMFVKVKIRSSNDLI